MKAIRKAALSTTLLTGLALVVGTHAQSALAQTVAVAAAETADETGDADSGTIVVTARKRSEDVLKTPVSVAVLTGEAIAAKGIFSINDVANNTPGINISNVSSGRNDRSFQQITLRGFTPSTTTSTLTATFIDGVPVASATALNSITDPARIEILKGPQAAYFGRNTFAGAVNVVNKIPGNDLAGSATASWGTRDNQDFTASLEGAIVPDRLMLRVAGHYFSKNGSYTNVANPAERLGDQKTYSGNALIVAKPTERLTIKMFGLYSVDKDGAPAQGAISAYEVRANNGQTNIPLLTGSNAGTVIVAGQGNCNLNGFTAGLLATEARVSRRFICGALPGLSSTSPAQNTTYNSAVAAALANPAFRFISPKQGVKDYGLKRRYYHLHMNVDYELGETGVILSSLTGYNNEYYSELADLDNYDSRLLANPSNPNGTIATRYNYYDFPFLVERSTKDFSQELRASYDKGPLKAALGVSYLHTKSLNDLINVSNVLLANAAPLSSSQSAPQESKTAGVFGGVTYEFGKLSISAEGRYQQDQIYAYTSGNPLTIAANNTYGLPAGTFPRLSKFFDKKFRKFLPRVIGQFQASNDFMTYASFSKGANISLASFNTNFLSSTAASLAAAQSIGLGVVVKPETLDNYEIGMKGKAFDGMIRYAVSGYYGIWKNQMNNRSVTFFDPAINTSQIVSGVANTGKSIVKGVEAEATIMPVTGISIDLAGAISDSSIRSYADPSVSKLTGVIGDAFKGNQLPGSSKYSANLGIQYRTDIRGEENASFFIRGDTSYKSRIFADAANLTWVKSRTQVNFRTGISKGRASIEAYLTNAFNNKGYTSLLNQSLLTPNFALASTYSYLITGLPELRTFGLKAGYKF